MLWQARRGIIAGRGALDAGAAAFTPASLSGLIGWYKADTGVTNSGNNTDATAWADQSGAGHNLTSAGAGHPKFFTAGFNSLNSVTFDPSVNTNIMQNTAFAIGTGNKLSCFVVCQMLTGTAGFGRLASYFKTNLVGDFDNAGSSAIILRDSSNNAIANYSNNTERCVTSISLATNYRLGMIFDGTNITPYVNAVAGTTGAYSTSWVSGGYLAIGATITPNAGWNGAIAEIVITNTDITSQLTQLDDYFKAKWGL